MGHWDTKNYTIYINIKKADIVDPRIIEYQLQKDYTYTRKEVDEFFDSFNGKFHTPYAEQLLKYIFDYKNGILVPNKWGLWEPIKNNYDSSQFNELISHLSLPDNMLFLKKSRKFDIEIENSGYGFYWLGNKSCRKTFEPKYMVKLTIGISKQSNPDLEFWKQFMDDFSEHFKAYRAEMYDMEYDGLYNLRFFNNPEALVYSSPMVCSEEAPD